MTRAKAPPEGWEDLECVGGPSCGLFIRVRLTEDYLHFHDGFYARRQLDATPEQKASPLWMAVRDVLDWVDDPQDTLPDNLPSDLRDPTVRFEESKQ